MAENRIKPRHVIIAVAAAVAGCLLLMNISAQVIRFLRYEQALDLRDEGEFDDAIAILSDITVYSDAKEQIKETKYMQAESLMNEGEYKKAADIFYSISSFSDSRSKWESCYDVYGGQCLSDGDYETALKVYEKLGDYNNAVNKRIALDALLSGDFISEKQLEKINELLGTDVSAYYYENYRDVAASDRGNEDISADYMRDFSQAKVGDIIEFGSWYHDEDDGKEPLRWVVVTVLYDEIVLLSEDIIDYRQFGSTSDWYGCELKAWLCGDFFNEAFTAAQAEYIKLDEVYVFTDDYAKAVCIRLAQYGISEARSTPYALARLEETGAADAEGLWWCKNYEGYNCAIRRMTSAEDCEIYPLSPENYAGVRPAIRIKVGD